MLKNQERDEQRAREVEEKHRKEVKKQAEEVQWLKKEVDEVS